MKSFNLKQALAGKAVISRSGKNVSEIHLFKDSNLEYPLYAIIDGNIDCYTIDGKFDNCVDESPYDLFMKDPEFYINVYSNGGLLTAGAIYNSASEAIENRDNISLVCLGTFRLMKN